MLYLIDIEPGGYNENTHFVVYDDLGNEINSYTERQILAKIKDNKPIVGICGNDSRINISACKIQSIPNVVSMKKVGNNNLTVKFNCIVLHKPIKIKKVKTGMAFIYKNVYMMYVSNRPVEKSCWYIKYHKGDYAIDYNTLKSYIELKVTPENIYDYMKNICDIEPYLDRKLSITIDLETLGLDLKTIDLTLLSNCTKRHYISFTLNSKYKLENIYVGNCDVTKVNFMFLTGYIKSKETIFLDFSSCFNDYKEKVFGGGVSDRDFGLPSTCAETIGYVFVLNNSSPIFNESIISKFKLEFLGYVPRTVSKSDLPFVVNQLKAKYILLKNLNVKQNNSFYVLVK